MSFLGRRCEGNLVGRLQNLPVGEKKRQVTKQIPFGRMGQPDEVAAAPSFLLHRIRTMRLRKRTEWREGFGWRRLEESNQ